MTAVWDNATGTVSVRHGARDGVTQEPRHGDSITPEPVAQCRRAGAGGNRTRCSGGVGAPESTPSNRPSVCHSRGIGPMARDKKMRRAPCPFDTVPAMVCVGLRPSRRSTVAHRTARGKSRGLERAGIEPAAREGLSPPRRHHRTAPAPCRSRRIGPMTRGGKRRRAPCLATRCPRWCASDSRPPAKETLAHRYRWCKTTRLERAGIEPAAREVSNHSRGIVSMTRVRKMRRAPCLATRCPRWCASDSRPAENQTLAHRFWQRHT
jgi:hypothetical protein